MEFPKIQVFIITYNRPDTLVKAIESVLQQTYPNVELVVSDNSTNDETYKALSSTKRWGKYKYIRRNPSLPGVEHLRLALNEAETEFFMVFHDDDEMLPNMVEKLYNAISQDERYSAAGSNAIAMKGGKGSTFFPKKDVLISDGDALIARYVKGAIAPFPSYMYHRQVKRDIQPDPENQGGKYCDVSFLFNLAKKGPIFYVGEPLMIYNLHPGQDSGSFDFRMHTQLTNYLLGNVSNKSVLDNYRLYNVYRNAIQGYQYGDMEWRSCVALLLIKHFQFKVFFKYVTRYIQSRINKTNK